jgi:predicted nucleic acid-binding protein
VTAAEAELLVDTSVAVALVVADHAAHTHVVRLVGDRRLGLAGHAAFETFSVLTRLPPPARRDPQTVRAVLAQNFPDSRFLSGEDASTLLVDLADLGIAGGSVFDALVAAAAATHDLPLATRDLQALDTYRAVGAEVVLV